MNPRILIVVAAVLLPANATAARPTLTLALGGDVMFGRVTSDGWRAHDPLELERWGSILRDADVALVNLETAICTDGRQRSKLPLLWAPAPNLDAVVKAGVDVVNLANNHALDCGPGSVDATSRALHERGIASAGVAETGVAVVGDVVVLGVTMHPPPYRPSKHRVVVDTEGSRLVELVAAARRSHPQALLVVSIHWGQERSSQVAALQRTLAHDMINAGANVIAGHGPHTPQAVETYAGAPIFYSLGNLAFDDQTEVGRPRAPRIVTLRQESSGWSLDSELPPPL